MLTRHIPNLLTSGNLVCGCLGIVHAMEGSSIPTAYFVWAACVFDFLDGFSARALKVSSPIGKELDSLADAVSFGVLPAIVMYKLLLQNGAEGWLPYVSFSIAVFSALRLAIFNLDETQRDSFKGMPTPANTLFISSLPLQTGMIEAGLENVWVLVAITVISSYMLVSRIELFAFKFKNFSWSDNKIRYVFLLVSIILLGLFQVTAIPFIILLYVVVSLGIRAFTR